MDYQTHIDNLQSSDVTEAQKAVDYLDGDQYQHMKILLSKDGVGIKKWEQRGVMVLWENVTNKIVDKSAQTYQNSPTRVIPDQEASTDKYNDLLTQSNFSEVTEDIDQLSRLLKMAAVIVQYSEETKKLYFEVLTRANSDIDYDKVTGLVISLLYRTTGKGESGGDLYRYWTVDKVDDIEMDDKSRGKVVKTQENPYGIVPCAVLFDIKPPRYGLYGKPVYQQLIKLNEAVNMFHIETKFNQRYQSFGGLFTNAKIKEGVVIGPDSVVELNTSNPDIPMFIEYRSPDMSSNLNIFLEWLKSLISSIGDEWGVSIKSEGSGTADSGFKLIVEEMSSLQLRAKRIKPAETFEQDLFEVIKKISEVESLGVIGDEIIIDFPAPDLPVNQEEKWAVDSGEIGLGLKSKERYIKEKYPNWSQEEVDKYLAEIKAGENRLPSFTDVLADADTNT